MLPNPLLMADHHNTSTSPLSPIIKRKSCPVCSKLIYMHQPILYCADCNNIYHGKCLGLTNDKNFYLQQISWKCTFCSDKYNYVVLCNNCNVKINFRADKFSLCKNCNLIHHQSCLFGNRCID